MPQHCTGFMAAKSREETCTILYDISYMQFKNNTNDTGMTQRDGMQREVGGGSGWGTHVNPWLIHVNVWQNHYDIIKLLASN